MAQQDAILKILEMLQAGIITADQADKLIRELTNEKTSSTPPPPKDLFEAFQSLGNQMAKGFEDLTKGLHSGVRQAMGLPPLTNLTVKILSVETGAEKTKLTIPLHFFIAVKGLLTAPIFKIGTPLINFDEVYTALEKSEGGLIAHYEDTNRQEKIEFWLE